MSTSTNLPQPGFVVVTVEHADVQEEAAETAAETASVIHDDYCAIHDEYGTCTCGAAQMAAEFREDG